MKTELDGRVALVTGASTGLGLAIAKALSAEGADVALLARDKARLEAAAAALDGGGDVLTVPADIASADAVDQAVRTAVAWKGRLNIVVNNAGPPMQPGGVLDHPDSVWADAFNIKALGMIRVSRAVLPHLAEDGTGRIVNLSGAAAQAIIPDAVVSGVVNGAIHVFTRYLAIEAAGRKTTVNAVSPGPIRTEVMLGILTAMGQEQGAAAEQLEAAMTEDLGIPAGRWGEPSEVADLVAFLASDRAAYITGQVLLVDGGLAK